MNNRFKTLAPIIVALSLTLIGCNNDSAKISAQTKQATSKIKAYDLIKYKDSYVGDNSAVANIITKLPANAYSAGFSLQTAQKPYGMTINYKTNKNSGEEDYTKFWSNVKIEEFLEKNAVVLLSLIKNADTVNFNVENIGEKPYKYDRKELEKKYGGDLKNLFKDKASIDSFLKD
ncbi:DUF4825 domain-containing protein [Clostridium folliculivorans]|uniref:DUF4825 domain-containing protein n=1 Tax=Clostridium folliculivorans TaxID=2886038 RepID=A0A9W6DBV8_9CLOT|nr:DUF4825 domain-containing protein [Clostridium folliculivorans]GKU26684.1 DUF4825 domain-containing protein [Clostridium folliculivorans]GKU28884.1 DUF4825 domain-containing protein [Clostridium folliculivorans]